MVWSSKQTQAEVFTTPAVNATHVVFGANDGRVYAVARGDGHLLWSTPVGADAGSPAIAGTHVVATGAGSVYVLGLADGGPVWSNAVSDEVTSPAVADGCIYVGTGEGELVAFGVRIKD
jgi:outer membrane protein assembly factor BamB